MISVNRNSTSPYARLSEGSRHRSTLAVHANQIMVRSGKGDEDRATMLGCGASPSNQHDAGPRHHAQAGGKGER